MWAKRRAAKAVPSMPVVSFQATLLMAITFSVYSAAQNVLQSSIRAWRFTFRDIYRTDMLDSLTFLFTDLKSSTELYERVGDIVAYDLVRAHFQLLKKIIASEAGAVVRITGDGAMATFPTPDRAVAAALRIRDEMGRIRHKDRYLLLKIGIHEGPCLAVTLDDRQDYFGQTVNIASRVQELAASRRICATRPVVEYPGSSSILKTIGLEPVPQLASLRGIADELVVYEIP